MRKYGFKLFNTNLQDNPSFVDGAVEFVRSNIDDMFIELMIIPSVSIEDMVALKQKFSGLEVTIHAPHHMMGFDPGNKAHFKENSDLITKALKAADLFASKVVVTHAGLGHGEQYVEETARQFKIFNDSRIAVENLPYEDTNPKALLHGCTPEEIKYIMDVSCCGFCFDFSHAICAANSLKLDIEKHLDGFYDLKPNVYHMCDGDVKGTEDEHMHYGDGNFPLKDFLHKFVASDAMITMETGAGMPKDASDWIKDYNYLKNL